MKHTISLYSLGERKKERLRESQIKDLQRQGKERNRNKSRIGKERETEEEREREKERK